MQRARSLGLGLAVVVLLVVAACTTTEAPSASMRSPAPQPTVAPSLASPSMTSAPTGEPPGAAPSSATGDEGGCVSLSRDYAEGARGSKGNPITIARRSLTGLQPADILTRARDEDGVTILIDRNDRQIGRVVLVSDSHGGWLLTGAMLCAGLGAR